MIPYNKQSITNEDIKSVVKVLKSKHLTQGPQVPLFEKKISNLLNCKFATATNSATSALHISCLALGLQKGDYLWTSPNSFVASSNCALYCGASVKFIDINLNNFNISIDTLEKELIKAKKNNKLPKILIPIHFAGVPSDQEKIYKLSRKYKFKIIEDASHSLGSEYNNAKVGDCKWSDITVFSFHPIKTITTGEGGMATTNNKEINKKLNLFRNHGITKNKKLFNYKKSDPWYYEQQELGYNYRMNDIEAALGLSQIKRLKKIVKKRNDIANIYKKKLNGNFFITQKIPEKVLSSYHLFVIGIKHKNCKKIRKKIYLELKKNKIICQFHYIPIFTQFYYRKKLKNDNQCPNSLEYSRKYLSIPLYTELSDNKQKKIIMILNNLSKKFQ